MHKPGSGKLGLHLKRLREERKLTLGGVEALSANHGERVNKAYLFRVERGKTLPTLSRLQVLSEVYQVRLSTLIEFLDTVVQEERHEDDLGAEISGKSFDELRALGIEAEREGNFSKASVIFREAMKRALDQEPSTERNVRVATARHDLSIALRNGGQWNLAREEAAAVFESPDLPDKLLHKIQLNLTIIYRRLGRPRLAAQLLDGLLSQKDDLTEDILALINQEKGSQLLRSHPREAARHYRSALVIEKRRKSRLKVCKLLVNIGLAELNAGNYDRSMKALHEARDLGQRYQFSYPLANAYTEMGRNFYFRGDSRQARIAFRTANDHARHGDYYDLLFMNHYYQWRMAIADGKSAEARAVEPSLKFFERRLQDSCEELEAYRKERL